MIALIISRQRTSGRPTFGGVIRLVASISGERAALPANGPWRYDYYLLDNAHTPILIELQNSDNAPVCSRFVCACTSFAYLARSA